MTDPGRISTCLWFDTQLEEAMTFYTGLFPDAQILSLQRDGEKAFTGEWTMFGAHFRGINGGPMFTFTEAMSISVTTQDQAETDRYWDALIADGGQESQCGWLKDRFGVSWQIVPRRLQELLSDPDPARAQAAMQAMLRMRRIVIADLEAAADSAA